MVFEDPNVGTREVPYYGVSHCFRTFQWTELETWFWFFRVKYITRRKTLWIDAKTNNSNSWVQGFHWVSSNTLTPKIMVLNDINIFIYLLYPTEPGLAWSQWDTYCADVRRHTLREVQVHEYLLKFSALQVPLTSPIVLTLVPPCTLNSIQITIPTLAPTMWLLEAAYSGGILAVLYSLSVVY